MIKPSQVNLIGHSENANEAEEVLEPEEVDICSRPTENAIFVETSYGSLTPERHDMTHLKSVIKNFIPVEPESWFVTGIGNTRLPVRGKGDIEAKSTINGITTVIPIPNVLFISKLGTNLFSIGVATSLGVKDTFTNDDVHFYKDGKMQLFGKRTRNTLYCLNILIDMEETDVATLVAQLYP